MSWGGSVLHMIITLRNNTALLRKKSFFKKEYTYFKNKQQYLKAADGQLNFKTATKEQLAEIRKKVTNQRKAETTRTVIILLIVGAIALTVFVKMTISIRQEDKIIEEKARQALLLQQEIELKAKAKQFTSFIDKGDDWLGLNKWHDAIHFYNLASELFPDSFEAKHRLAIAYTYICQKEKEDCTDAKNLIDKLIETQPDNTELYQLRASYYYAIGDTTSALADLDSVDKIINEP